VNCARTSLPGWPRTNPAGPALTRRRAGRGSNEHRPQGAHLSPMSDRATDSGTSTSLLVRLQQAPADEAAWAEFVRRYGARIHVWGRRWGLQEADAHDVSQDVLLKLVRAMQAFRYDPSQRFRGWLKTIAHHAWQDLARGRRLIISGGGS